VYALTVSRFKTLLLESKLDRDQVRSLVARGRWRDAEPDVDRSKRFAARRAGRGASRGAESVQGDSLDYQPASFLVEGAAVRRAVAYVEASFGTISSLGTGFLISPRLFITNQHVIPDSAAALGALITFDRELDESGRPRATTSFTLDPDSFCLFSDEAELDFALVAIGPRQSGQATLADLGCCPISDAPNKHVLGMNTNIIQHPNGMRKLISIRNNLLVARTQRTLLYETDTETGSSGSPVFNDEWDLVALHHYGEPSFETKDDRGRPIPTHVNEGIRASVIFTELERRLALLPSAPRALLVEALELGRRATAMSGGPVLGPPKAPFAPLPTSPRKTPALSESKEISMSDSASAQTIEVVIPLRVSIAIDGITSIEPEVSAVTGAIAPVLGRKAEALRVDVDYSNRNGYVSTFIPGIDIALPTLTGSTAAALAPLRASEPRAEQGELRYQNFSVKLNRSKKMAIFTATNIDGETYLSVDRTTGEVSGGAEGERWFEDPRVSASFFLDQTFYSEWSTYFDRGHLTRRADPTWGSPMEAQRANADTFHFSNCSPQHFRFNQSSRFWQGIERYVLEAGVLAQGEKRRLCVFQGPLFDDAIDRMAGDVQIPSSFFKIVCWKGTVGLKAVGMVVDQGALLDEPRRFLGQPQAVASVNVNHWRVSIAAIETRAGLDLGPTVRDADTIDRAQQPVVGREALQGRLITRMEDLIL